MLYHLYYFDLTLTQRKGGPHQKNSSIHFLDQFSFLGYKNIFWQENKDILQFLFRKNTALVCNNKIGFWKSSYSKVWIHLLCVALKRLTQRIVFFISMLKSFMVTVECLSHFLAESWPLIVILRHLQFKTQFPPCFLTAPKN